MSKLNLTPKYLGHEFFAHIGIAPSPPQKLLEILNPEYRQVYYNIVQQYLKVQNVPNEMDDTKVNTNIYSHGMTHCSTYTLFTLQSIYLRLWEMINIIIIFRKPYNINLRIRLVWLIPLTPKKKLESLIMSFFCSFCLWKKDHFTTSLHKQIIARGNQKILTLLPKTTQIFVVVQFIVEQPARAHLWPPLTLLLSTYCKGKNIVVVVYTYTSTVEYTLA